jgi:hypothetical protein
VGGPDPIWGVQIPFQGSGPYTWGSWTKLGGPDCISRGSALSYGGLDSLLTSWSISLSLDTWRPRTCLCGGVRRCCWPRLVARGWGESWPSPTYSSFTTRLKIAAWVLRLYTVVRGTLVPGYRQGLSPSMMANPVIVPKANGKLRMCIDYTSLNKACPKDPYPLP